VVIEWKEIKNVSNGLTKAKAIAAWKEAHIAELCETCHGERAVLCPTCKGTMHDPAAGKDCKTCKGELLVNCKGPKCKDGKTPCPRTCLKLAEGKWVKKEDGKTWRSISTGVGTWQYSSGHAGELIDMKTGQSLGKCPTCGGKQIVECATCVGLGKVPCATCTARKDAAACPDQCELGKIPCDACKGKGLRGG
jgi:hypothetical protein